VALDDSLESFDAGNRDTYAVIAFVPIQRCGEPPLFEQHVQHPHLAAKIKLLRVQIY
jgi:hypothetical protein